jgi:hypothetical protein
MAAPLRPEIDQRHAALDFLVEIAVGDYLHVLCCHPLLPVNGVEIARASLGRLQTDPYSTCGTCIYFDVLTGGCVPGKVLLHARELNPLPGGPITINAERPHQVLRSAWAE